MRLLELGRKNFKTVKLFKYALFDHIYAVALAEYRAHRRRPAGHRLLVAGLH